MEFVKQLMPSTGQKSNTEYNWNIDVSKLERVFQDGYDPLADTLEQNARVRFIAADRLYFSRTNQHIDINEGTTGEGNARRSCRRQMQLWMSWRILKQPEAAPANLPGCSHHNYGIAVDLKNVSTIMREILQSQGWSDIYQGEEWHFTCIESTAFDSIQAKISELRNGPAGQWSQDMAIAFELNKRKNTYYAELKERQKKFEGDAIAFNKHAQRHNDARVIFESETEPYAQRRDEILSRLARLDRSIKDQEILYREFRVISDEVIRVLTNQIDEIRRLMALSLEELDQSIRIRVPLNLKNRYETVRNNYFAKSHQVKIESAQIGDMIGVLGQQVGNFEQRAISLLREYEFLKNLRFGLEEEKNSLERGFVDVQLMANESFFRMNRAGQTLDEIQAEVDSVSA